MTTQDDLLPVGLEDALPARARAITTAKRAMLDAMDSHGYDRVRPPLVEVAEAERAELQTILDGWRSAGVLDD